MSILTNFDSNIHSYAPVSALYYRLCRINLNYNCLNFTELIRNLSIQRASHFFTF